MVSLVFHIRLGFRLVQSQNATAAARLTADRKFLASLSWRVAMRRKSLRRQNMASTRQRSFVILDRALAVASAVDYRDRVLLAQGGPDAVGIVTAVCDLPLHSRCFAD